MNHPPVRLKISEIASPEPFVLPIDSKTLCSASRFLKSRRLNPQKSSSNSVMAWDRLKISEIASPEPAGFEYFFAHIFAASRFLKSRRLNRDGLTESPHSVCSASRFLKSRRLNPHVIRRLVERFHRLKISEIASPEPMNRASINPFS